MSLHLLQQGEGPQLSSIISRLHHYYPHVSSLKPCVSLSHVMFISTNECFSFFRDSYTMVGIWVSPIDRPVFGNWHTDALYVVSFAWYCPKLPWLAALNCLGLVYQYYFGLLRHLCCRHSVLLLAFLYNSWLLRRLSCRHFDLPLIFLCCFWLNQHLSSRHYGLLLLSWNISGFSSHILCQYFW